jgi:hypothetical protein
VLTGSLARAIEALDTGSNRRLRPLEPVRLGPLATMIAALHLGDPAEPADSWRPWRRGAALTRDRPPTIGSLNPSPALPE